MTMEGWFSGFRLLQDVDGAVALVAAAYRRKPLRFSTFYIFLPPFPSGYSPFLPLTFYLIAYDPLHLRQSLADKLD